jgi:hypothetical protein
MAFHFVNSAEVRNWAIFCHAKDKWIVFAEQTPFCAGAARAMKRTFAMQKAAKLCRCAGEYGVCAANSAELAPYANKVAFREAEYE